VGFTVATAGWAVVSGVAGLVVAGLWGLTDHAAAYQNENVLQVSFLMLLLLGWVPRALRNARASRWALAVMVVVTGLAVVGLLLKLLPGFYQVNGEIIALALPVHLGVAAAIWQLRRA
jgi:hypothetical protein